MIEGTLLSLTGTTMAVKRKENVQCRVVLIQTAMHKKRKRNQRELKRDFNKNNVHGRTKRKAKTIWA